MFYKLKMKAARGANIVRQWFWHRKLDRVKAEHGGDLSKASPEVVGDLLGPIDPELGKMIDVASAIQSLSTRLGKDRNEWELYQRLGDFLHLRCDTADEEKYILDLIRRPNPRQAVLDELINLGDLKDHQLNYHKEAIDKWLLGDVSNE